MENRRRSSAGLGDGPPGSEKVVILRPLFCGTKWGTTPKNTAVFTASWRKNRVWQKHCMVSTPIGNLGDFSPRAQEVLSQVDFIAAEDTRWGPSCSSRSDQKKPQISYFEHNWGVKGQLIAQRILAGRILRPHHRWHWPSGDPGCDLVEICPGGYPGVGAVSALAPLSPLCPSPGWDWYMSEGFLSVNKKLREHLEDTSGRKSAPWSFARLPTQVAAHSEADFYKTLGAAHCPGKGDHCS